jgi:hypothetical protein
MSDELQEREEVARAVRERRARERVQHRVG